MERSKKKSRRKVRMLLGFGPIGPYQELPRGERK